MDAEIAETENVGPPERKEKNHLGGPDADPFQAGQGSNHIGVGHPPEPFRVELTRTERLADPPDIFGFFPR